MVTGIGGGAIVVQYFRPQEWVDSVTGLAEMTGVAASFTVAEVALESAWGASQLARQGTISQFLDAWQ